MDSLAILQSFSVPVLEDVLPNVIKHLSQKDRGNWRLASKSMYQRCTRLEITKDEKFIINGSKFLDMTVEMASLTQRILSCERLRTTVELRELDLRQLPPAVWTHLGRRITSLTISDSRVDEVTICLIISECPVLEHLRVENLYRRTLFSSESLLDEFIDAGVERPTLRSLEFFEPGPICESVYWKLLRIYPCVEKFGRYVVTDESNVFFNNAEMEDNFAFLNSNHKNLKEVKFIVENDGTRMMPPMQLMVRNVPALTELMWKSKNVIFFTESEFVQLLETIVNLETLDLRVAGFRFTSLHRQSWKLPSIKYNLSNLRLSFRAYVEDGNEVTLEILRRCHSLRFLSLDTHEINDEILECIFRDHTELRVLQVNCENCSEAPFTGQYRIDRLRDLETLDFCTSRVEAFAASLNCPKLKSLSFRFGWVKIDNGQRIEPFLNILCERSPNLELLKLSNVLYDGRFLSPCLEKFRKLRHVIYSWSFQQVIDCDYLLGLFQSNPCLEYVFFVWGRYEGFAYGRPSKTSVPTPNSPYRMFSIPYFSARVMDINMLNKRELVWYR